MTAGPRVAAAQAVVPVALLVAASLCLFGGGQAAWAQATPLEVQAFLAGQSKDCRGCDLRDQVLARRDFVGADLSGANLTGAVLVESNFTGANLSGADLSGADVSTATLRDSRPFGHSTARGCVLPVRPYAR